MPTARRGARRWWLVAVAASVVACSGDHSSTTLSTPPSTEAHVASTTSPTTSAPDATTSATVGTTVAPPTTAPGITEPDQPRPAPANLRPTTDAAATDVAASYFDGCHVGVDAVAPLSTTECRYGATGAERVVVIFGDSHAAQWLPALSAAGERDGFAVVSFTKSGCSSATLTQYNPFDDVRYAACDAWRTAVIQAIHGLRPALVLLGNYPAHAIADVGFEGDGGYLGAWWAGLHFTISRLQGVPVAIIGITPNPPFQVPACVAKNRSDTRPCDLPRATAVDEPLALTMRRVASERGVAFFDPVPLLCGPITCPAVIGPVLVYRDDSHLTAEYSAQLADPIGSFVLAEAAGTGAG